MTTPTQQPGWHEATLETPDSSGVCYTHGPYPDIESAREAAKEVADDTCHLVPDEEGQIWIIPT